MLRKLIAKMVGEELSAQTGKTSQAERLAALESENAALKEKLENSSAAKRLKRLKDMVASIPAGAQGMGMIAVIEDGTVRNLELKSKADLEAVVERAEKGELEVLGT